MVSFGSVALLNLGKCEKRSTPFGAGLRKTFSFKKRGDSNCSFGDCLKGK